MVIDLRKLHEPLAADKRKSLAAFAAEHAGTSISTVALWGEAFSGASSLHVDMPGHSAAFVEELLKYGRDWYGEDG